MTTDEELRHLRRCVELASEALEAGDEPFGSMLVAAAGTVLAEDRNRVASGGDPTRHPEFELAHAGSLDAWMAYLRELLEAVTRARRLGLSALATVETVPPPRGHGFPRWHPAARMNWLVHDLHRLNVLATYRELERQPTAA